MYEKNKYDPYEDSSKICAYTDKGLIKYEREIYSKFLNSNDTVLDVGCFVGRVSFSISNQVKQVVGIDVSRIGIEFATRVKHDLQLHNCNFLNVSATEIPFRDEYFTKVIVPYNGLEDILTKFDRMKAIKEFNRVLKTSGLLIFSVHNRFYYRYIPFMSLFNLLRISLRFPCIQSGFLLKKLKGDDFLKILHKSEFNSLIWREPGSILYLSHYFYSISILKDELEENNFKIIHIFPIEQGSPHSENGLKGDIIREKSNFLLVPGYYIIAKKL